MTSAGRLFHAREAATGNARSPSDDRRVNGTSSVDVAAERNFDIISRSKPKQNTTTVILCSYFSY